MYLAIMRIVNVFYALAFVGVFSVVPDYVHWLSWAMSLAVALLLLFWFQPYRATKHVLSEGDDAVLFGSGMIILTDVVLTGASRIPFVSDWARSAQSQVDGVRGAVQDSTRSFLAGTTTTTTTEKESDGGTSTSSSTSGPTTTAVGVGDAIFGGGPEKDMIAAYPRKTKSSSSSPSSDE